jgi:hypothetical protein
MQPGEIVAALMAQTKLSLEGVAERVRGQGAPNVKYQHIQQLLEFPNRRPRYLPELAAAFDMSVEEFLAFKPRSRVNDSAGDYAPSHRLGTSAEILAASTKLVRLACENLEVDFDPEDTSDADIVLRGCSYLYARKEREVTAENVVDFTKWLRKRLQGIEASEREDGAGSIGRGTG